MTTTTHKDFESGKRIVCENTGKKYAGKALWRDVKSGDFYERMNPNGVKLGQRGTLYFRRWNDETQEFIKEQLFS